MKTKHKDMIVIGITGSIGMGKTTISGMFRDAGVPVFCSDEAVHALLSKGGDAVDPVRHAFPESYDEKTQAIDRKALGRIVFGHNTNIKNLESILHPLVQEDQQHFIEEKGRAGFSIVGLDIPLLFETGAESRLDVTVCVSAPAEVQKQRVMARPNMTEEKFSAILATQMPDAEKRRRSDYIVDTGQGLEYSQRMVHEVLQAIKRTFDPSPQP